MDMDISMDIHVKSVDMDMDMDVKIHIHGNPEKSYIVNRQSGIDDSKYVISRDPLLINHVILHMRSANLTNKMAYADYICHLLVIESTYRHQI